MFNRFQRPRKITLITDEELFRRFITTRDAEVAGELFSRFTHLVFGVCFKYLKDEEKAKDALMSVFERLLTKPPDQDILNVKNWLYTVTKNQCLFQLRQENTELRYKEKNLAELKAEIMEKPVSAFPDIDEELESQNLHKAVQQLKTEQKTCIELFYFEDKSYFEITEITGFSFNQVKSHLQNGKRNLKSMLENVHER